LLVDPLNFLSIKFVKSGKSKTERNIYPVVGAWGRDLVERLAFHDLDDFIYASENDIQVQAPCLLL